MVWKAKSGEEAGSVILSSKRVSDGSRRLDLGGVSALDVSLVLGGMAVVWEGVDERGIWSVFFWIGGVIVAEGLVVVAASFK
jgi:hypothetical protein